MPRHSWDLNDFNRHHFWSSSDFKDKAQKLPSHRQGSESFTQMQFPIILSTYKFYNTCLQIPEVLVKQERWNERTNGYSKVYVTGPNSPFLLCRVNTGIHRLISEGKMVMKKMPPYLLCQNMLRVHQFERVRQNPEWQLYTCARLCSIQWIPCCFQWVFQFYL